MDISVVTTLYNYNNYVIDTIKSFLKQDFEGSSEIIIVDDASTDNPYKNIKKYESENVRYIRLDKNMGYSYAKNVGIKSSRSEILVMLDADDMLTKESIRIRYERMKKPFDLVHGPVLDYRNNGNTRESSLWKKWLKSKKDRSCYRLIHAQSVMLRKDIHRKIGLYDESLKCKSDREMWARIFNHGFKVGYVKKYVSYYRRHSKQMHRSPEKAKINDKLQKRVLKIIERRSRDLSDVLLLKDFENGNDTQAMAQTLC